MFLGYILRQDTNYNWISICIWEQNSTRKTCLLVSITSTNPLLISVQDFPPTLAIHGVGRWVLKREFWDALVFKRRPKGKWQDKSTWRHTTSIRRHWSIQSYRLLIGSYTPLAKLAGRDQKKIKLKILGISWLCISTAWYPPSLNLFPQIVKSTCSFRTIQFGESKSNCRLTNQYSIILLIKYHKTIICL